MNPDVYLKYDLLDESTEFIKLFQVRFPDFIKVPFQIIKFIVYPGYETTLESHPSTECWIVESGTGKLFLENQEISINPGKMLYIPSGFKHQVINDGELDLTAYAIFW